MGEKLVDEFPLFDFREKIVDNNKLFEEKIKEVDGGGKPGYDHCFLVEGYRAFDKGQIDYQEKTSIHNVVPNLSSPSHDRYPFNESFDNLLGEMRLMAKLEESNSGRSMEVYGTQPGCQIYTSNWFGTDPKSYPYLDHNAICIETEFPPNSVNMEKYKNDIMLQPGRSYKHRTCHIFYMQDL